MLPEGVPQRPGVARQLSLPPGQARRKRQHKDVWNNEASRPPFAETLGGPKHWVVHWKGTRTDARRSFPLPQNDIVNAIVFSLSVVLTTSWRWREPETNTGATSSLHPSIFASNHRYRARPCAQNQDGR